MNREQAIRYDRQIRLSMIGVEGQARLQRSTVAIVGCGALGTVNADILARAGVGRLKIIDRDIVEWTNLQRQSLYEEQDAVEARAKAETACDKLSRINSQVRCEPHVIDLTADNIDSVLGDCDLVVDASDNFEVRLLLNDYSLEQRLPWVHGGCVGTAGQVAFFRGLGCPCFRCLVPTLPPAAAIATCDTAGVLGSATHAVASLQATEALKWLAGQPQAMLQGVWSIDFWTNRNRVVTLPSSISQDCAACGLGRRDFLRGGQAGGASVVCGRQAVRIAPPESAPLDLSSYAQRWRTLGEVTSSRFFVRCRLSEQETLTLFRDGRALVEGTDDVARARSLYAQLVGA